MKVLWALALMTSRLALTILLACFVLTLRAETLSERCLWGGNNETTTYSLPSYPGMGSTLLAQAGGMRSSLPVQSMPNGIFDIPQANIPSIPSRGPVGSVGHPATSQNVYSTDNLPAGATVKFVRPLATSPDGVYAAANGRKPLVAWEVVAEGTPGAVAMAVRPQTVYRAVTESQCVFAPVVNTQTKEVRVVNPRTGRVVGRYFKTEDVPAWIVPIPILHREERTLYEAVSVEVATPL
ncbi:MAG: hypothetical protein ACRC46_11235 [Thermoguttaceae bacterium]